MSRRVCSVGGCRNELSPRSQLEECAACRAYLLVYLKSSPARTMERRQKIHLYDSRLQVIMPGEPEELEGVKLQPPANYKPQSKKGKALVKRRTQATKQQAHASA